MAPLKRHKLMCPSCGETVNIHCKGGRVKIFDSTISVEYILNCGFCNLRKSRTMFSEYGRDIKIHGLSCPFCNNGRKRHIFLVELKEVTLSKKNEEMNRVSRKKKQKNNGGGNGKNKNKIINFS